MASAFLALVITCLAVSFCVRGGVACIKGINQHSPCKAGFGTAVLVNFLVLGKQVASCVTANCAITGNTHGSCSSQLLCCGSNCILPALLHASVLGPAKPALKPTAVHSNINTTCRKLCASCAAYTRTSNRCLQICTCYRGNLATVSLPATQPSITGEEAQTENGSHIKVTMFCHKPRLLVKSHHSTVLRELTYKNHWCMR
jgi:hypothetical protein